MQEEFFSENKEKQQIITDPENIEVCYGKYVYTNGKDPCSNRKKCKWGNICKEASREELENKYYHNLRVISLGNMFLDPEEVEKEKKTFVSKITQKDTSSSPFDTEETENVDEEEIQTDALAEIASKSNESIETWMRDVAGIEIPNEETLEILFTVIEKIVAFSDEKPFVWKCLKEIIYKNKNQSKIAKEMNMTRQGVSKRLYKELSINDDRNTKRKILEDDLQNKIRDFESKQSVFKNMTVADFLVYRTICNNPGCSVTQIAEKTLLARKTVYAAIKKLKEVYNIELKTSPYAVYTHRKKNETNSKQTQNNH